MSQGVPDIVRDKAAWFNYFDVNKKGLGFEHLIQALAVTPSVTSRVQVDSMRQPLAALWPAIDRDRSSFIDFREFMRPGGIGEAIVAQVCPTNSPAVKMLGAGTAPSVGARTSPAAPQVPADYRQRVQHVMSTLPRIPMATAEAALRTAQFDPDLAVHQLIAAKATGSGQTLSPVGFQHEHMPMPPPPGISAAYPGDAPPGQHMQMQPPPGTAAVYPSPPPLNTALSVPNCSQQCRTPPPLNNGPAPRAGSDPGTQRKYPKVPQTVTAPTFEVFRCYRCQTTFSVDSSRVPLNVSAINSTCPSCGIANQVTLTRPGAHMPVVQAHLPPPPATAPLPAPAPAPTQHASPYIPPTRPPAVNMSPPTETVYKPLPGIMAQPAPPSTYRGQNGMGRRRALLIGINYYGQRGQLKGCIHDVENIFRLLVITYGWDHRDITVLIDSNSASLPSDLEIRKPTRSNILSRMKWLVGDCRPGDTLFLQYSGHGSQQEDPHGVEEDGMNETILPVDFSVAGQITDDEMSSILVQSLPEGVRLTAVMDSCHSGTGLDLPYTWTTKSRDFKEETNPYHTLGDVQLFSGCEDDGVSADAQLFDQSGGAMTTALCEVLRGNPCPTYVELLLSVQTMLNKRRFKQRAQLSSSQIFNIDRPFLLDDAMPNSNATIGRTMRRKFPPRKRRNTTTIDNLLGLGAVAAVGGAVLGHLFS